VKNSASAIDKNRQLIAKCVSGDSKALEAFVRRYSDIVYRSVQYTLKAKQVRYDKQDLEDFHHDVFSVVSR
jgi:hypothetical protein